MRSLSKKNAFIIYRPQEMLLTQPFFYTLFGSLSSRSKISEGKKNMTQDLRFVMTGFVNAYILNM